MANDKRFVVKNGLATQNIQFVDSTNAANNTMTVELQTDNQLVVAADDQLLVISDDLGNAFTVNDATGIPSIQVTEYGNVLIGDLVDNGVDKVQASGSLFSETIKTSNLTFKTQQGTDVIASALRSNTEVVFVGDNTDVLSMSSDSISATFAVNDFSGMPNIEVLDTGTVKLAETFGNILIGTSTDNGSKLQVNGNTSISGAITASAFVGNASTATALQTARTIALTGDVTGSVTFDGTANASISTTIAPNSVALGTDTTGNYIATIAGTSNEIEVTGSGSESSAVTIGLPDSVSITSDLNVGRNLSIATGNLIIGTSGKGIDFSATAGTGTSELFDDYEKGTWTPTIFDAASGGNQGSVDAGSSSGDYTKIGNVVSVHCLVSTINTTGMTAGNVLYIGGLPYAARSSGNYGYHGVTDSRGITTTSGGLVGSWIEVGQSRARLYTTTAAGGLSNVIVSNVSSGNSFVYFSLTYHTN